NDRRPFDFILDTGAGTSLLSSDLAKQLEAKVIGSKEGQSAGGKVSVSLAKVQSLAVGETKLHDVDVGVVDLAQIDKTVGPKIDGRSRARACETTRDRRFAGWSGDNWRRARRCSCWKY